MSGGPRRWRRVRGTPDVAGCLQVTKSLQRYLDHEVDEVTARRIARHLEICRRCGLEARTYLELKRAISRTAGPVPPDALRRLQQFAVALRDADSSVADGDG